MNIALGIIVRVSIALVTGLLFAGIARKTLARLERRYGPPFWQEFFDIIKLFLKRERVSNVFGLSCIIFAIASLLAASMFIPVGNGMPFDSPACLITIYYLIMAAYLAILLGLSESNGLYSIFSNARAGIFIIGYGLVFITIIISITVRYNSSSLIAVASGQIGGFTHWNIVTMPVGFIASMIMLHGVLTRKPFGALIADEVSVTGFGSKTYAFVRFFYAINIYIHTALITVLFLGGGTGFLDFTLKQFLLFIVVVLLEPVFARYRIKRALGIFLFMAGALAFVQLILNLYIL
jgi:NADH-quinone oxidoreductase subunit H